VHNHLDELYLLRPCELEVIEEFRHFRLVFHSV
jgi:hypothetical protein